MQMTVKLEEPSKIVRKMTVCVSAQEVSDEFQRGLVEVQRTAKLKGFRPGQAPISVIRQFYGDDLKHRVFHKIIDESYRQALNEHKIHAVGAPKIETPDHRTGEGAHDHGISEDQDLTYTATVEILPEIEVKGYTGLSLTRENVEIKREDEDKLVTTLLDSHAELIPASGGLVLADGSQSSRPVQLNDFVDLTFSGALFTEKGREERADMKGTRLFQVGSNELIPGFEDRLVGMRKGETKTFEITFPKDFHEKSFADRKAEFTATVNEVKEKKVPELNDDFAKQAGYENVDDFKKKVHEYLLREKTDEVDKKVRSELVRQLIEKNPFEVPSALVQSQLKALIQELAEELKRQGTDEKTIQEGIGSQIQTLQARAESQVRASLILETIAAKEGIQVGPEEMEAEIKQMAASMQMDEKKLSEFYQSHPDRREDLLFRMRQERTIQSLLGKAKIKSK